MKALTTVTINPSPRSNNLWSLNRFLQVKETKPNSSLCLWWFPPTPNSYFFPVQGTFLLPWLPGAQGVGAGATGFHPTCRKQPLLEVVYFVPDSPTDREPATISTAVLPAEMIVQGQQKRLSMHKFTRYFCAAAGAPSRDAGAQLCTGSRAPWTSIRNIWVNGSCC